jgi:hypothetical protein
MKDSTSTSSSSSSTITYAASSSCGFDVLLAKFHKEWLDLYYKMLGHMAGMAIGEALIIWYLLWRFLT